MTLHWWMHWFWVTTLLALLNTSSGRAYPQEERRAKAMYPQGKPASTTPRLTESKLYVESLHDRKLSEKIIHDDHTERGPDNTTDSTLDVNSTVSSNATVATLPSNQTEFISNLTVSWNASLANASTVQNLTAASWPLESDTEVASHIVTEKPWSLETTLLERSPDNQARASKERPRYQAGMDAGAIAGISFAALALASLAGTTAFVMYRRRYLNKPQTLNDKCSNPDSSGYLDDSTIRDNSEEMYSLDNDSFLNSLEAMTIQNYWTDVKHSKL